jgi:hypothetical protein
MRPDLLPAEELLPRIPSGETGPGGLAAGAPLGGILTRPHSSSVEHLMMSRQKTHTLQKSGWGQRSVDASPRAFRNPGVLGNPPLVRPRPVYRWGARDETSTLSEEETFPAVRALMRNPRLAPCWRTCWLS